MSISDYVKARKLGEKDYQHAVTSGKWPYLPALDEMLKNRHELHEEHVGLFEIPLSLVKGTLTKGRQQSFASNYMPLLSEDSEFAAKWINLFAHQENEGISDPVNAYEFMGRFYIAEGNKRISVLKYLGQPAILAEVIRILPPDIDTKEIRIYNEFLKFFNCTNFYSIIFNEEGNYEKLAEILGLTLSKQWPEKILIDLKSAFFTFSRLYAENSDAFLMYLEVFGIKSLLDDNDSKIKTNIALLRKEFNIKTINFSENPEPEAGKTFLSDLSDIFTGFLGGRKSLKISFIYDGDPRTSRWLNGHEQGRLLLGKNFAGMVETRAFVNCKTSEKFDEAVSEGLHDGAELFITTSPAQIEDALRAAVKNPDAKFLNCSVHMFHNAVRSYCGRMYEAKFLQGILAGILTQNNKIAYVSNYPLCGTVAGINAFAIGAAMVNPRAEIFLSWSSLKNKDLNHHDADIVSGADLPMPENDDGKTGLYAFNCKSIINYMNCIWNWGRYYSLIIDNVINNSSSWNKTNDENEALNYWWGMSSGVIDVSFSDKVPAGSLKLINAMKHAIIFERFNPFDGELISQDGSKQYASLTEDIVKMSWLNYNVKGNFPVYEDLTLSAQKAVKANGLVMQ